jgi:integrase
MKSDYMKPENYKKLFVFMTYENTLVLRVSLETGLRVGDVLKMRPCDLRGRTITYTAEKTGKKGKAVVCQDLANRLKQVAGEKYIFPKRGKPDEHRSRQAVWKDVKKAAAALRTVNVITSENITPHSARKTFAVEDAERYGLRHTQRQLQHRDKRTTKLYAFSDKYIGTVANDQLLQMILNEIENLAAEIDIVLEKLEENGKTDKKTVTI